MGPRMLCFTAGTPVHTADGPRGIEELRVGQRVLTLGDPLDEKATRVDPARWRMLRLRMQNPDGSGDILDIEALRSLEWMERTGAKEGRSIFFGLPEMALFGVAEVLSVRPVPEIESGPGRVVLGTVTHMNSEVLVIALQGSKDPLEPTATHRLYSTDRKAWVPSGELREGEHLLTQQGPIAITSITPKPGIHRVFNIEVETEHSYLVTPIGVLSHNQSFCGETGALAKGAPSLPPYTGGKTSGVLRTAAGDMPLISGYKGPSAAMGRGTPGMNGNIKSHVEAHAASVLRQTGLREGTLYINKVPCPGRAGCAAMLERMLPEGAKLRVVGPDGYNQLFIGTPD